VTVRIIILLFASTLAAFPASAQQRQQPTTYGPNMLSNYAARIEQGAVEDLKADPRSSGWLVDLDVFIPDDRPEFEALGKYTLLVFATFSDNRAELPLAKVYSGGVPLQCLAPVWRDVPPKSASAKAYGKFRSDSLCLLPIDLALKSNSITVDFAKNRKASEVTSYPIGESAMIKADTDPRSPATPDSVVLTKIINREFPGFGFQVSQ
jgi:hypothetical protein